MRPSTIHGNPKRGNGILNNELYVGKLVWNRQRFIKDPDTGKRVSRLNPDSESKRIGALVVVSPSCSLTGKTPAGPVGQRG